MYSRKYLSIPLRMKLSRDAWKDEKEHNFQFLWGWNRKARVMDMIFKELTFNSFEDETEDCEHYHWHLEDNFQFLWGWNIRSNPRLSSHRISLSIPLRMKLTKSYNCSVSDYHFQFLWGWNSIAILTGPKIFWLSIPLRMKRVCYTHKSQFFTFNSFEDETRARTSICLVGA